MLTSGAYGFLVDYLVLWLALISLVAHTVFFFKLFPREKHKKTAEGGLVLHGEQEFVYHKPVQVGETLHHEGKIVDLYSKESKGKTMTFLVMENVFTDDGGEPVVTERFNLIHRK